MSQLPSTFQALVLEEYGQGPKLQSLPMPPAISGTVVVKILAVPCTSEDKHTLYSPKNPFFSNNTPFVPGVHAVGRVAAVGPDATSLTPGQLVLLEPFVRGRDDQTAEILKGLYGGPSPKAQKLAGEETWKNGNWAEYARVPLENAHALNEKALLGKKEEGGLEYEISDLPDICSALVAYGGFRSVDLKAGETVLIAPATGGFSGAAVQVASAMGAKVIAVGRNKEALKKIADHVPRVHPVQLTGDAQQDVEILKPFGPVDVYLDFTPAGMKSVPYLQSGLAALKFYGKAVLMGFPQSDISASYGMMIVKNLTLRARYMYDREDIAGLIKLVERGLLKLGKEAGHEIIAEYSLDKYEEALEKAGSNNGWGQKVMFRPNQD